MSFLDSLGLQNSLKILRRTFTAQGKLLSVQSLNRTCVNLGILNLKIGLSLTRKKNQNESLVIIHSNKPFADLYYLGLLKPEFISTNGVFIALAPKSYCLTQYDKNGQPQMKKGAKGYYIYFIRLINSQIILRYPQIGRID